MSDRNGPIIGAIDIGSNSFQITIARVSNGEIEIIERAKETVRLADVVDRSHVIPAAVIDRCCVILSHFRDLAIKHDAALRVSATAALRNSRNADAFIAQAREVALVDVRVIDAMTEARLIRQGVHLGMPHLFEGSTLCVDVGGGSTEFSVSMNDHVQLVTSVPLGAVNVCSRYLGADPVSNRHVDRALKVLESRFTGVARSIRLLSPEIAVSTGGSIQRVARLIAARDGSKPSTIDGIRLRHRDIAACVHDLRNARTQAARIALPGMDPDRADVLLGGALIFQVLGTLLSVPEWTVSMNALRAGLLSASEWPP